MSRRNRKNSRRSNRKASRRNNMNTINFMNMMGGKYDPMEISLDQGSEYLDAHKNQHGGGALSGAPVDYEMRLDPALVPSSRTAPLDAAIQEIQGMSDFPSPTPSQAGGRRRRRGSRKGSRKASRKNRKAHRKSYRKNRKGSRRTRRMRGGALALASAPINSPNMLLSPFQAAKAGTADFSNPLLKY
jgi:hypothetical protein